MASSIEESSVTGAESEEGEGLCAELSLCEDQVPAVGQQTEIGEETGDEGEEEDVVSSLTLCEPESGVSGSTPSGYSGMSQHQESVEGEGASSAGHWYLYAHGTTNADTRVCQDTPTDVHPDSVQQEEAVTTSSELSAVTVPLHGHADSSLSTNQHVVRTGVDGGNDSVEMGRGGSVNLVNYDSSDSDDSSVKTPRLENLQEEEGHQFQYPDSNSLPLKTEDQKDVSISSSSVGQSDAGEQGQGGVGEDSGHSEGYWNEQGYWVDSQGQVWQPQGQDPYWQGQEWSQQTEGQGGDWHGGTDDQGTAVQRYDSQGQWVNQGSGETQSKQAADVQEQSWSSGQDGQEGSQGSTEDTQQQQSTSNQQAQYSSHDYYQQQYAGQQYDSSATESQYYDHTAYYGQERYDASQQQVKAESGMNTSDPVSTQTSQSTYPEAGEANSHQQSSYPQPTNQVNYSHYQSSDASQEYGGFAHNREWSQAQEQQNQGHYDQGNHDYNPAQPHGQPEQAQYDHQDQVNSCDPGTQAQHYDQSHYTQQHHAQPYSQQGQYGQQGSMQYSEQQTQPCNHSQTYGQHDQYNHQQPHGPQDEVQYRQQQEMQPHSSYNQQSYDGWYQQSAQQGYGSGNWNDRSHGGNDGSYYHYSDQQSERSGYHTWEQPAHHQQQQYYDQQYGSQQGYGAQTTHTSGYQTQPVMPPPGNYHQNNPHPSPPLPPPSPLPSHPHIPPPPPHIPPPPPHHFPPPHPPHPPPPRPLPPSSPSQLHHHSRNYSSRTQPSWQHRDQHQNDPHWKKWKYNRRDSSQNRGSHQSPSGVPSSPVNSVSSDVSSTSRDSPTPVQQSPGADSPEHSDQRSSKPVFSNQLRDPRRSSPPTSSGDKSSLRNSKYTSTPSSLVRKRSAPQKQSERSSPAGTPDSSVKTEKSGKENKGKASSGEPLSFPKNTLSGFRIPKHNKSTGQSQAQSESRRRTVPVTGRKCEQTQPSNSDKVKEAGSSSEVTREQGTSTSEKSDDKKSTAKKLVSSAPAVHLDIVSTEPVAEVKETTRVKSTKDGLTQPSEDTSRQDLVSLFKSIDDSTLHALASTIKLALNSSNSQHVSYCVPFASSLFSTHT